MISSEPISTWAALNSLRPKARRTIKMRVKVVLVNFTSLGGANSFILFMVVCEVLW